MLLYLSLKFHYDKYDDAFEFTHKFLNYICAASAASLQELTHTIASRLFDSEQLAASASELRYYYLQPHQ